MTVYRRRLLCLALALSMLITLIPAATGRNMSVANAATARKGITLVDKVNLRYGAGTNEKIIFSLPADHVCDILEVKTVQKVRWYRVETIDPSRKNSNKYRGYIHGDFFRELTSDEIKQYENSGSVATPTPVPDSKDGSPTPTPTPKSSGKNQDLPAKAGSIGSVTAGGTNLREGPGTGYHSITRLDRNTQVELLTIPSVRGSGSNTFFKVKYNGNVGYIMSDFISILSGGPENGESVVVTPKPGSSATAKPASGTGSYTHVRLILTSCHLRTSPGGDYDQSNDLIGRGSVLPLNGSAVKQGGYTWYPVSRNGKKYYVRNDCVELFSSNGSSDPTAAPKTTATPEPTVNPNGLGYVQTIVGGCNLRATVGGTVIKQIAKNVTLPYLLEPVKKNGYTWYFVQDGSNRGYLRGDVVKVVKAPANTTAPSGDTATAQPAEDKPAGYVKTTASGVNLRKKAGYTDVLGRIDKNVVLPYYGSPSKVKGVTWYNVKSNSLGKGWLHADYLMLCNADGTAIATTVSDPGQAVTVPGGTSTSQQEASYTTLKTGSTGTAVKNLVTELKNQGYFSGSITSKYTTAVAAAVKAFQKAKGLTVDGIAGSATQHKLFGTVPVGAADTSNLTMTLYPAEKIDWYTGGINDLWAKGSNYKVYDVKTGIVWWAHRWSGGTHVDAEPLTAADTARLCKSFGVSTAQEIYDKNLYQRRPLLVTIGTRTFACSLYGVPHNYPEGDTISTNNFKGQVCIHFTNSKTHNSNKVDSGHVDAIQYAWEHAPNGHK